MKTVKVRTPEEQRGESHKELSDMTPQGILIREADRHSLMNSEPKVTKKVMAQHTCYADSPDMPLTVSQTSPHRDGSEGQVIAVHRGR